METVPQNHKPFKYTATSLSIVDFLSGAVRTSSKEAHSPCPLCGGKDRFVIFLESNRAWCRQCGWKGDTIQLLRDRDGYSFFEAKRALGLDTSLRSRYVRERTKAHNEALAAARQKLKAWEKKKFNTLVKQYHELDEERKIAELAYRATQRVPNLYSTGERKFWTFRLASFYDCLSVLDYLLDILMKKEEEAERFEWWRSERNTLGEVQHG